ncbi:MAG: carboxypeptidase regulatory-like domain-containing protein [Crocinitomicaceae bacterium]|nr:carboxypeptidase regulatory-like domain-containing protein [Crocinitomicaceae bacterium]
MKKITLTIIVFACCFVAMAQSGKLKKADDFYGKIAYAQAIPLYSELLGSTVDSPKMLAKLADCYYQIGETSKSEEYFGRVVATDQATSDDVYKYAQSLKENGKYAESDKWMKKFHSMKALDMRGTQFSKNKTYIESIEAQGAYFSINHLGVNTEHTDFGGYPMKDGITYFVSNRKKGVVIRRSHTWDDKGFLDLYSANAMDDLELENVFHQSRKVNKKYHEGPLCFSQDDKMVYFTRNNMSIGKNRRDDDGIQNLKMFRAEIDENGKWINEKEFSINSKDYSVGHPSLSSDGNTIYFASDMPGGFGGADLYKMSVNADGSFGEPVNLGDKVNTEGQEMFPWVSNEGLLFFASDGHLGLGGLDVFVMIPKKDGSFDKRINVGKPVNSPKDDFALIMNSDNMTGYVSSNRETGSGGDDIYSFKLLKPFMLNLSLKGVVTDVRSNEIIPGAIVSLLDKSGNVVASTTADDKGSYEFDLEPNLDYTITAHKDDYFDNSTVFTTENLNEGTELIEKNVNLEKDPGLSLYAIISDAKTKEALEEVKITVKDNVSGEQVEFVTSQSGDYFRPLTDKKLNDQGSYNFSLSKEGYISKTVTYNMLFDKKGQYDVHNSLDLSLEPVVIGITDLIEINSINFDLDKAVIRPDAEKELNKIVDIMNKYPLMEIELGSHTDCRASKAYNIKLSHRRAKASAAYIKSRITNPKRIYGKGYGESILLNGCGCEGVVESDCPEEEHEKNRRTEFKVISVGSPNVQVKNNSTNSFGK